MVCCTFGVEGCTTNTAGCLLSGDKLCDKHSWIRSENDDDYGDDHNADCCTHGVEGCTGDTDYVLAAGQNLCESHAKTCVADDRQGCVGDGGGSVGDGGGDADCGFCSDSEFEDIYGGLHSGDEGDADAVSGATQNDTVEPPPAEQMDLLHQFGFGSGKRSGQSRIYTNKNGVKIPVSDAEHYAYRSKELRCKPRPLTAHTHTPHCEHIVTLHMNAARAYKPRTYRQTPHPPLVSANTRRAHTSEAHTKARHTHRRSCAHTSHAHADTRRA